MTSPRALAAHRVVPAATVFVLGLTTSIIVGLAAANSARGDAEVWLEQRGEVVAAATLDTVDEAIAGLTSTAAFIEQSTDVTDDEFDGFVQALPTSIGLIGVAYADVVEADDLDRYVADRQTSEPGFGVFTMDSEGQPMPIDPDRARYYPVEHFVPGSFLTQSMGPADGDARLLSIGFEAGSEPAWLPSLEYVVAERSIAVSGFANVGTDATDLGNAFVVIAPVHAADGSVTGVVGAPMVDFLLTSGIDLSIAGDVTWSFGAEGSAVATDATWVTTLDLPGISWDLTVQPESGHLDTGSPWWAIAAVGTMASAMVAAVVHLLLQRRRSRLHLEELERIDGEKNRFLASVSHEIRTPLTVVTGLAHELRSGRVPMDSEEAWDLVDLLVEQGDAVAAIVEDLLVASRSDMSEIAVTAEPIDLRDLADTVLRGARVATRTVGGPAPALGDPQRVQQILRNLLSNARRYGGLEIEVDSGADATTAWVTVADSGPPIPLDRRHSMFEAYTSAHPPRTNLEAMGLGLYVSSTLARLQRGSLTYDHDGRFGAFTLRLPALPASRPGRVDTPIEDRAVTG